MDYYYCTGDGEHRSYEDYIEFGFIAAGQQGTGKTNKLYSEELKLLKKGDRFFAFNKKKTGKKYGFIAYGEVLEEAKRIDDFRLDNYPNKRLWEIEALKQKNIKENHDNAASEYCCKVKWLRILNENEAVRFTDSKYTSAFTGKTVSAFNTKNQKYILKKLIEKFREHDIPITNNEDKEMKEKIER